MHNITILVCLYNKSIDESNTIQSLLKVSDLIKDAKIFIWDNSLKKLDSRSFDLLSQHYDYNFKFLHNEKNSITCCVFCNNSNFCD